VISPNVDMCYIESGILANKLIKKRKVHVVYKSILLPASGSVVVPVHLNFVLQNAQGSLVSEEPFVKL
jgi:hypothetical protein